MIDTIEIGIFLIVILTFAVVGLSLVNKDDNDG